MSSPERVWLTMAEAEHMTYRHESPEEDRVNGRQTEYVRADLVLDGDWLWLELMDWCKARGVTPSDYNDLFAIVKKVRAGKKPPPGGAP